MSASGRALTLAIVLSFASGGTLAVAQSVMPPPTVPPASPSPSPPRKDLRIGVVGLPQALDPMAALEGAGALV